MPKISVIVPIYNVEKYIERCVRSLFEQTLEDIEFIFINDCTQDKSIDILKLILEEYPNRKKQVTIHKMDQNSGLALVREWGIKNATGDYIIHCDSDDWIDKNMYYEMYDLAISKGADVVICDFVVTDGESKNTKIKACHAKTPKQFIANCLHQKDYWAHWNKLYKRDVYNQIEFPTSSMGEDFAITMQLFLNIKNISYIPKAFYYYYQNPNSIIHKKSEEATLKRYYQLQDNTNIVIKHLENSEEFSNMIMKMKPLLLMNACTPLLELFENKKYREMWRSLCPNLSFGI